MHPSRCGVNSATQTITAMLGIVFGISGFGHGFFEVLQGYVPTNGLYIDAIGEAQCMWEYGKEPAFTLIPNFLITGIAAMLVSIAAIVWSAGFLHKKRGPLGFLLLFSLSLLVGAGVAQILIIPVIWAFSTRIHKPLVFWRKVLTSGIRRVLSGLWIPFASLSVLFFLYVLQIAIFGFVPGVLDPDGIRNAMLLALSAGYVLFLLAYVSGFAYDIGKGGVQNEKDTGSLCVQAGSHGTDRGENRGGAA